MNRLVIALTATATLTALGYISLCIALGGLLDDRDDLDKEWM